MRLRTAINRLSGFILPSLVASAIAVTCLVTPAVSATAQAATSQEAAQVQAVKGSPEWIEQTTPVTIKCMDSGHITLGTPFRLADFPDPRHRFIMFVRNSHDDILHSSTAFLQPNGDLPFQTSAPVVSGNILEGTAVVGDDLGDFNIVATLYNIPRC